MGGENSSAQNGVVGALGPLVLLALSLSKDAESQGTPLSRPGRDALSSQATRLRAPFISQPHAFGKPACGGDPGWQEEHRKSKVFTATAGAHCNHKAIGPYTIPYELGHGAMGTVYRHDPHIDREVALETISLQMIGADETVVLARLSLTDQAGNALTAEQVAGRVVAGEFWATWCPPGRSTLS